MTCWFSCQWYNEYLTSGKRLILMQGTDCQSCADGFGVTLCVIKLAETDSAYENMNGS